MEPTEVEQNFPCGKVEQSFGNYPIFVILVRLAYSFVAALALWHSLGHAMLAQRVVDSFIVLFALWRIYHQSDKVIFLAEKGIVIKRRPTSLQERIEIIVTPEKYFVYANYENILGFTENWEEMHVGSGADVGIYVVLLDLQFVSYKDKMQILTKIKQSR